MATSITASTTSPFTGLLLTDANYSVSASFPLAGATGSTPSLNFPNVDFPTVGKFIVQISSTALTNTSNSLQTNIALQDSSDNITFTNIGVFTSSLLAIVDTAGSASAKSVQVLLAPTAKQYLRATATVPSGGSTTGGITGSYSLQSLF